MFRTLCGVILLVSTILNGPAPSDAQTVDVWFGTGGNNCDQPEGIYLAKLKQTNGKLSAARLVYNLKGAGWVALHPEKPVLYSTGDIDGEASVLAFAIGKDRSLTLLGSQPTSDNKPCHLTPDKTAKRLFSAQYGGGSISTYQLDPSGLISKRLETIEHKADPNAVAKPRTNKKGNNKGNGKVVPHPHYVATSPDNRFVFVADLGLDQILRYQLDPASPKLTPAGNVKSENGFGPRHMKFHPSGKFLFVVNELALSVTVYDYDAATGELTAIKTVPAISEADKAGEVFNSASEIRIHSSGKFVYSANRGHDSITVFKFDEDAGSLTAIQNISIRGSWPRNFNISPNGQWLIAAGAESNSASLFSIDQITGQLTFQKKSIFVPGSICVTFGR